MKICLLDKTEFRYSYADRSSEKLRGAESVLINLFIELKALGHEVHVFNNCSEEISKNSKNWFNLNELKNNNCILSHKSNNILSFINPFKGESGYSVYICKER